MNESAFSIYSKKKKKAKKQTHSRLSLKSSTNGHGDCISEITNCILTSANEIINDATEGRPLKKAKRKHDSPKKKLPKPLKTESNSCPKILTNLDAFPSNRAKELFEWMLNPMKSNQFFELYWESQILHITRLQPEYFTCLLTSSDIDVMLRAHPLYFGRNVDIVKFNNGIKEVATPVMRAQPSIVWDAYAKGYSVRILNPQTYNNKVHLMLATLQEYFGTMVGANVYLTPAGSQGFAPHFDDIEAFIIQLEGKKYWKLYKPFNDSDNLARFSSKDFTRDQLGELLYEIELNAGDVLYFPRGIVHEAKTGPNEHSLHITISTYQRTSYADLLEQVIPEALQAASNHDIDFRKGLPIHYLKHIGATNTDKQTPERIEVLKTVQNLFIKMVQYLDVDEAGDKLGRKFMHDAMPPVLSLAEQQRSSVYDGTNLQNGKITNGAELTMNSSIRLCRYYSCRFVKENGQGVLYFSTQNAKVYHEEEEQFIPVDIELGTIVELLLLQYPQFTKLSQFDFEDPEKLLDFMTQLWDYGIITTQQPLDVV